jgi:hypothetical protein
LGVIAVAVTAATVGIAASADAGEVPTPTSSNGVSHELARVDRSDPAQVNDPNRPADLTPEEVHRLKKEARIATSDDFEH